MENGRTGFCVNAGTAVFRFNKAHGKYLFIVVGYDSRRQCRGYGFPMAKNSKCIDLPEYGGGYSWPYYSKWMGGAGV